MARAVVLVLLLLGIAVAMGCAPRDDAAAVADDTSAAESVVVFARVGDLTITHAAAPAPIGDRPAALYFTVHNAGSAADTLVAVSTPAAGRAEVHDQVANGGTMVMTPVAAVAVPTGATVRLAPGGLHVMLEERRGGLAVGDTLRATLTFRRAGEVGIAVPVVGYGDIEAAVGGKAEGHGH